MRGESEFFPGFECDFCPALSVTAEGDICPTLRVGKECDVDPAFDTSSRGDGFGPAWLRGGANVSCASVGLTGFEGTGRIFGRVTLELSRSMDIEKSRPMSRPSNKEC